MITRRNIVTIITIIGLIIVMLFSMLLIKNLNILNGDSTEVISTPNPQKNYSNNIEFVNLIENTPETIDQTIARIKRDVIVTGTITGIAGKESAMFQIEGMADMPFQINTQLMDGFIITEITKDHVVLKNQIGEETFTLKAR